MDTPEFLELKAKCDEQGGKIREMKAAGAGKDEIIAEVGKLKAIKADMEKLVPGSTEDPSKKSKKDKKKNKEEQKPNKKEERKKAKEAALSQAITESFEKMSSGNDNFVVLPMLRSQSKEGPTYTTVGELDASLAGKTVTVRARVHTSRGKGKACFLVLRERLFTVQVALFASETISKEAVKWTAGIPRESIVDVEAVVAETPQPVEGCTQSAVELQPVAVKVVSIAQALPFQLEDAMRNVSGPSEDAYDNLTVHRDLRLDNRWVDLRTPANQAIFRVESAVSMFFRNILFDLGFIEIHTPKIIGAASESGASVFKLGYFGSDAFLAQSPQLYKQMAIAADLGKVFTTGGVFRAENANTHRHLCEFVGLDLEMEFKTHYHEVLDLFGKLFTGIFDKLNAEMKDEINAVRAQYPFEDLVYPKETLIITFAEGIAMLKASGDPIAEGVTELEDIDTPQERLLGKLVKEKYNTDFYIMDKFPKSARPFYTMPDPNNPDLTNSYDIYIRGQEILSGAQRIHDYEMLKKQVAEFGVDGVEDYVNSFKHGCPPHAGGGIGMERVVMLFLGLSNIRMTSMFPRTPVRFSP